MITLPFLKVRGEVIGVTTKAIRTRMDEVSSKIAAGINPYHKGEGQVMGSRETLPTHVRAKDEAAGLKPKTPSIIPIKVGKVRRRGPKAASKIFDGPVETVDVGPVTPPGHTVCVYCRGEFPDRLIVWGHPAENMRRPSDKDLLEEAELTLKLGFTPTTLVTSGLKLMKHVHNELVSTNPVDFEEVTTHSTPRALPACRGCSGNFKRVEFGR